MTSSETPAIFLEVARLADAAEEVELGERDALGAADVPYLEARERGGDGVLRLWLDHETEKYTALQVEIVRAGFVYESRELLGHAADFAPDVRAFLDGAFTISRRLTGWRFTADGCTPIPVTRSRTT